MADHYLPSPAGVYTYQALETPDSIRLLTLHPSPRDAPITCTLTHIPMDQSPPYRALSYEWGSQPDLSFAPLTINNLPFSRPIQANLSHALVEIRSPNEDVTLWIDALCINQCSPLEKSHQVGLMSTIFRSATSVIAWLGPEADNSSVAMSLIADKKVLREKAECRDISDEEMAALISIAYRSYWTRVWIMQEFFLAKTIEVRCGREAVPYDDEFREYISVMSLEGSQFQDKRWKRGQSSPPTHVHFFSRLLLKQEVEGDEDSILGNKRLFSWLKRSYDCRSQAGDPRDYVYALLGLADDVAAGEIVPDYEEGQASVRGALMKVIPVCLRSMHPRHRKYSDRWSRAGFFIKYAQKMGIAIDEELQREIAKGMYINSEDLDLKEEMDSEYQSSLHTRHLSAPEMRDVMVFMEVAKLAASRGKPLDGMVMNQAYRHFFPSIRDITKGRKEQ